MRLCEVSTESRAQVQRKVLFRYSLDYHTRKLHSRIYPINKEIILNFILQVRLEIDDVSHIRQLACVEAIAYIDY